MNSIEFERLLSYHLELWGHEAPTLRDMVFDYYCGQFKDLDKANAATKLYTDEIYKKFVK
jgi:hypothetical protein